MLEKRGVKNVYWIYRAKGCVQWDFHGDCNSGTTSKWQVSINITAYSSITIKHNCITCTFIGLFIASRL
jgi:hypothetical protein